MPSQDALVFSINRFFVYMLGLKWLIRWLSVFRMCRNSRSGSQNNRFSVHLLLSDHWPKIFKAWNQNPWRSRWIIIKKDHHSASRSAILTERIQLSGSDVGGLIDGYNWFHTFIKARCWEIASTDVAGTPYRNYVEPMPNTSDIAI